jgi:hypothetical protein
VSAQSLEIINDEGLKMVRALFARCPDEDLREIGLSLCSGLRDAWTSLEETRAQRAALSEQCARLERELSAWRRVDE